MKPKKEKPNYVELARAWAHKNAADYKCKRKWLKSTEPIPFSYDNPSYRVEVEVLEGSPHRAVLIICRDWAVAVGHRRMRRFLSGEVSI